MTTFVQQLDAQGPVVVERVSTQFADIACSADNARKLVNALHNGTAVTLTTNNGQSATFTPAGGTLGYGETYIALALAAEALRNAGVTGCATPDQWQAVLLGGPLNAAGTSRTATTSSASASTSSNFPGILTLRTQGQGWGQIAQTTNVQLGQVMSTARTSFNIDANPSGLSPTGVSSSDFNRSRSTTTESSTSGSNTNQNTSGSSSGIGTTGSSSDAATTGASSTSRSSTAAPISSDIDDRSQPGKAKGKRSDNPGKAKGHDRDRDDSSSNATGSSGSQSSGASSSGSNR